MKSYTDLEQSKKLAEILPIESADMEYLVIKEIGKLVGDVPFVKDDSEVEDSAYSHTYDRIACWSLTALLNVFPVENNLHAYLTENGIEYRIETLYAGNSKSYHNSIDACFNMILKLHELKML